MSKKTLIAEFFTTVSFNQYMDSIYSMTFRLLKLRYGNDTLKLEEKIVSYIGNNDSKIITFYNGRSALYYALKIIGIKKKDEIIVSGFTCVTVSNAVIQSGGKIIYSDIEKKTFGFDLRKLEKNITANTKVIIVQHTFGKPSNIKKILKLAKEKKILIIEDCAHSLGSEVDSKKLGSYGDFSIFSTGRDKVISGVTGGFLLINNLNYQKYSTKVVKKLTMPSFLLTIRNLNYNLAGKEASFFYDFSVLGKLTIFLSRKFKLITEILTKKEKNCNYKEFNYKLPNSLAFLCINQFNKINIIIKHNISLAHMYNEGIENKKITILFKEKKGEINNYFRFPILLKTEKEKNLLYEYMRKNKVLLGNTWSGGNIVPIGSNIKKAGYTPNSCPIAEDLSKRILTLPNHINIKKNDIKRVLKLINNF